MHIEWIILFLVILFLIYILLLFRVHIKSGIQDISFDRIYKKTVKAKRGMSTRLTEQAYIKGLNEGYALAKAQYESRKTSLYYSTTQYICQECNYKVNRDVIDTPCFCARCGCKFEHIIPYPIIDETESLVKDVKIKKSMGLKFFDSKD